MSEISTGIIARTKLDTANDQWYGSAPSGSAAVTLRIWKRHFAYASILNELSSEPESTVPVLSNAWT
jgi:hypothetical protein